MIYSFSVTASRKFVVEIDSPSYDEAVEELKSKIDCGIYDEQFDIIDEIDIKEV